MISNNKIAATASISLRWPLLLITHKDISIYGMRYV